MGNSRKGTGGANGRGKDRQEPYRQDRSLYGLAGADLAFVSQNVCKRDAYGRVAGGSFTVLGIKHCPPPFSHNQTGKISPPCWVINIGNKRLIYPVSKL